MDLSIGNPALLLNLAVAKNGEQSVAAATQGAAAANAIDNQSQAE
jgi:hypothetical protein